MMLLTCEDTNSFVVVFSKLPAGTDQAEILGALPALGMFVENQWGSQPNRNDLSLIDDTLRLNNLTVPQAVKELGLVYLIIFFGHFLNLFCLDMRRFH